MSGISRSHDEKNLVMYERLKESIQVLGTIDISYERKSILQPLIDFIRYKKNRGNSIRLNFICTHNSRRSHFAQVWAQTLAYYFDIKNVECFSGGTEGTRIYPKVIDIFEKQGFKILQLSDTNNPVIGIKYDQNEGPVICFSKAYHHDFNPGSDYMAVMVCDDADENCPVVIGAESRTAITYFDPKKYDHTEIEDKKYLEKSTEIGSELYYIFSNSKD